MRRSVLMLLVALAAIPQISAHAAVTIAAGYAVASTDGGVTWQLVESADALEPGTILRTSGFEACQLVSDSQEIRLEQSSELSISKSEQVELRSGQCQVTTDDVESTLTVLGHAVTLHKQTKVTAKVDDQQQLTVSCSSGTIQVDSPTGNRTKLHAGQSWDAKSGEVKDSAAPKAKATANVPSQGLGQLLVNDAQSGSPVRLNIARYHVNVVIEPPVALVQIDQSFYNPYPRQNEGTFIFNLPHGASVSRFAMYVTPQELIEGELIERKHASSIYETIVSSRRDPAILEQVGDNLFKMRVFPIFARDVKRILLDYTVPIEQSGSRYRFELPLLSDLQPIWDFRVAGVLKGDVQPDSVRCLSHPDLAIKQRNGSSTFDLSAKDYKPTSDFTITARPTESKPSLRSWSAEPLEGQTDEQLYFSTELPIVDQQPVATDTEVTEVAGNRPLDMLILVDTSAEGRDLDAVRASVKTAVQGLRTTDRFQILCYDSSVRRVTPEWTSAGTPDASAALDRFEQEFLLGGSDLQQATQAAVKSFGGQPGDRDRVVLHIVATKSMLGGEGPFEGAESVSYQLADVHANYVALLLREPKELVQLTTQLANELGGQVFRSAERRQFVQWLHSSQRAFRRVKSIRVTGAKDQELFLRTAWTMGQPLRLSGRCEPDEKLNVDVTYEEAGKVKSASWQLPVESGAEDVFLGRLWAQRMLDRLTAQPATRTDQVIALSQEWSLLSPLTAFLVLEKESEYAQWHIVRSKRRRYWSPAAREQLAALPRSWINRIQPATEAPDFAKLVDEAVGDARNRLEQGDATKADSILDSVALFPEARKSKQFADLRDRARQQLKENLLLQELGIYRALFTPSADLLSTASVSSTLQLPFRTAGGPPSEHFKRWHPHYEKLLQPATLETDGTVQGLATALQNATGVKVVVDGRALEDAALQNARVPISPVPDISLYSMLALALSSAELRLVEQPELLLITTAEKMPEYQDYDLYPLEDLFRADRLPTMESMRHPIRDREDASHRRIRASLEKPVKNLRFKERPLADVARSLESVLDGPVIVDRRALEDAAIDPEVTITAEWNGLPARTALKWLLEPLELTYVLRHESLLITTREKASSMLSLRTHSLRGIAVGERDRRTEFFGSRGWGGGGMGGAGGMMGGFGGGMGGGMGGVGGGFFGGSGGNRGGASPSAVSESPSASQANSGRAALSEDVADTATPSKESATSENLGGQAVGAATDNLQPAARAAIPNSQEQRWQVDFDSVIETITTTIQPNTWDEVGGPGSILEFEPTLDLVLSQTDDVHDQIERLLSRLRRMPLARDGQTRLAEVPRGMPGPTDFASFIHLITTTCSPSAWDEVGGPCSVKEDAGRDLLVISAYPELHDQVGWLMTQLRRNRYEALQGTRPWETGLISGLDVRVSEIAGLSQGTWQNAVATPASEGELRLLSVREEPNSPVARWRRHVVDHSSNVPSNNDQSIEIRRTAGRLEIQLPSVVIRIAGDKAEIGYGDLLLARATDTSTAQAMIDTYLPGFLHRSNRDLARAFDIEAAEPNERDPAGAVRIRFRLPGRLAKQAWFEGVFVDGQTESWEAHAATGLAYVIKAIQLENVRQYELHDREGKPCVRWSSSEGAGNITEVPPLGSWPSGWLVEATRQTNNTPFCQGLNAAMAGHYQDAAQRFQSVLRTQPKALLPALLHAWCEDRLQSVRSGGTREDTSKIEQDVLAVLRAVAKSPAAGLHAFISTDVFPWLEPDDEYELLKLRPGSRAAEDWVRIIRLARSAKLSTAALKDARASAEAISLSDTPVDLLLEQLNAHHDAGAMDEVIHSVDAWTTATACPVTDLIHLAETLAALDRRGPALKVLNDRLNQSRRSAEDLGALYLSRARLQESPFDQMADLVAAITQIPRSSRQSQQALDHLRDELRKGTTEPSLQLLAETAPLWVMSVLIDDRSGWTMDLSPDVAAELCWKLYSEGQLKRSALGIASAHWNEAKQTARVIAAVEANLRKGSALSKIELAELELAYAAAGRMADANRANSTAPAAVRNLSQ